MRSAVGVAVFLSIALPGMLRAQPVLPARPLPVPAPVVLRDLGTHAADAPAIQRMVQQGILGVVSPNAFAPDATMTRGEFALGMQRMFHLGAPPPGTRSFQDVAKGSAIAAAVAAVTPYMNFHVLCFGCALPDQFLPDRPVTRAEVAVTLVDILAARGKVTALNQATLNAQLGAVSDAGKIPPLAREHVAIAVENNLLALNSSNQFTPASSVTRANAAVILDRTQQRFSIPVLPRR